MYCKLINGSIVSTRSELPPTEILINGDSCSNFNNSSSETQLLAGWYPLVENYPIYDPAIETVSPDTIIVTNIVTRDWVKQTIDINILKQKKDTEINSYRDSMLKFSTFDYLFNGETHPIEISQTAKTNIIGRQILTDKLTDLGMTPATVNYACYDGHIMTMTPTEFTIFALSYGQREDSLYQTSFIKRMTLASLVDPLDVVNFDVQGGW